MKLPGILLSLLACMTGDGFAREVCVQAPEGVAPVQHGLSKLEAALAANRDSLKRRHEGDSVRAPDLRVEIVDGGEAMIPGEYRITKLRYGRMLMAGDAAGAMYGLLYFAEEVRAGTHWEKIPNRSVQPQLSFRAIKFNLPFAAYRTSVAIEQHQETCRDVKYWEAFLDMMAENRFNTLSLWSLHPFHYLTVPKSFPEAQSFTDAELSKYQELFTAIFKMAKERGIETYLVNWNTFVSPAFAKAHDVSPWSLEWKHFGPGTTNQIVADYTRECVTQVIDEYPDLSGLGITLGERMGDQSPDERRDWLKRTFFDGIAAAGRPVKLLYRAPLSADTKSGGTTSEENDRRTRAQIESLSKNITGPVFVEFKHNWSHGHSSPDLFIVHGGKLSDAYWNPEPTKHKVVWTMRNEDMFVLRWGQPDFVREFVGVQKGKEYVGGAIIGSECYIPALDYFTRPGAERSWKYAFERQWLFYRVWGRLLYDPATSDAEFERDFDLRFGQGRGVNLLAAWKAASQVPLHFASFYQGRADGTLYTEGFSSWRDNGDRKFFDVNSFINHAVLDAKRYINIADYVKAGGKPSGGVYSPPQLADELDRLAATAEKLVAKERAKGRVRPALEMELTDIQAWGAYANYFAEKLRGGLALADARAHNDLKKQAEAIDALERAVKHWKRLAELGGRFNALPVLSNSKEPFSWESLISAVEKDVDLARAPLVTPDSP